MSRPSGGTRDVGEALIHDGPAGPAGAARRAGRGRSLEGGPHPTAALPDLVWTLVATDFKARYHGAVSGFVWALLKPLAMFAVLVAVFSLVFATDPNYRMNLIVGLFLWDFFAEGTKTGLASMHAKGFLLTKARFPSWIPVLTSVSNPAITLAVFSVVIVLFLIASGRPPTPLGLSLYLFYLAQLMVMVVGISLASSVLFLRYRDLNQIWDVAVQAGFFVAPVIYPLGILPEHVQAVLFLWPPTPVIELARAVLVEQRVLPLAAHVHLTLQSFVILGAGMLTFRRLAPRAAEYL